MSQSLGNKQKAHAKSLVLRWFDKSGQPCELRGKFSSGIDRFFDEVAGRDSWSESMSVLLDSSTLRLRATGRDWCAISYREGLGVSTVVPAWGFGWQPLLGNEYVYDVLSWLGHYARQYIHRSHVAKVLMIVWEREGSVLHPFGSAIHTQQYGLAVPPISSKDALSTAIEQSMALWGEVEDTSQSCSRWTSRNTFDPAIHQAVFHFLRGQTLLTSGFELEALVAFDCVMQSLQMIGWSNPVGDPRRNRADLIATLGAHPDDGKISEHIYFLRNEFAAHAGGWRWWDTNEYLDEESMQEVSRLALRVLQNAADAEPAARRIDPEPSSWSNWLLENFPLLFSAIWFRDGR